MYLAALSITALMLAIAIGYFRHVNIGMISIMFAFFIGHFLVGLSPGEVIEGWPFNLFFMLLAMTFLFGIARVNGTLELFATKIVEATRGRRWLIPIAFFLMSAVLAAPGAGNISICALILPIAMTVASEQKISHLFMATMVMAGANAGGLSPIAPTGIIGVNFSQDIGYDIGLYIFYKQIVGQSLLAVLIYFAFRGYRLKTDPAFSKQNSGPFNSTQKTTMVVFLLVVCAILFAEWDIGLTAFTGSVVLLLLRTADEKSAMEAVPWSTIVLICGVGMLVSVAEQTGGIDMMANFLTGFMNETTAAPIMAVIGGALSIVSSASGVAMPTLIPTVPAIVAETGADGPRVISSLILGAHVVTNSPISTLGALAVASAGKKINKKKFFKDLFLFAFAGLGFAALIVYIGIV